jgi:hypothetical protein
MVGSWAIVVSLGATICFGPKALPVGESASAPAEEPPRNGMSLLITDPRKGLASLPRPNNPGGSTWPLLNICVTKQGTVSNVIVVKAVEPASDASLVAFVETWKFRPFIPHPGEQPVPFCFSLQIR